MVGPEEPKNVLQCGAQKNIKPNRGLPFHTRLTKTPQHKMMHTNKGNPKIAAAEPGSGAANRKCCFYTVDLPKTPVLDLHISVDPTL